VYTDFSFKQITKERIMSKMSDLAIEQELNKDGWDETEQGEITLVYFNKEDADFLSHSSCLYTEDFHMELLKGKLPNGTSKPVMHFYEDQLTALTAYKIFDELNMDACLTSVPLTHTTEERIEWVVVVDDPEKHAEFLSC
jgi:hypothetical protein